MSNGYHVIGRDLIACIVHSFHRQFGGRYFCTHIHTHNLTVVLAEITSVNSASPTVHVTCNINRNPSITYGFQCGLSSY